MTITTLVLSPIIVAIAVSLRFHYLSAMAAGGLLGLLAGAPFHPFLFVESRGLDHLAEAAAGVSFGFVIWRACVAPEWSKGEQPIGPTRLETWLLGVMAGLTLLGLVLAHAGLGLL